MILATLDTELVDLWAMVYGICFEDTQTQRVDYVLIFYVYSGHV